MDGATRKNRYGRGGVDQVAGRFGAPVNIHQEWSYADELERAFRAAPETTFV
jgi:hypothetical protein